MSTNLQLAAEQKQPEFKSIDIDLRRANRRLRAAEVMAIIERELPALVPCATVVRKWVWVAMKTSPEPEVRRKLAQLGFHWNRNRQVWQHPGGKISCYSRY